MMTERQCRYGLWCGAAIVMSLLFGCGPQEQEGEDAPQPDDAVVVDDTNFPLEDLDTLVGDHPETQGKTLERYNVKYDLPLPPSFDVHAAQSPVRSQGRRGTCSIFSTVGLMEHLYIKAGMGSPDFSEQYLQWSSKVEGGYFPKSGGSSGKANLSTINRYGIVEESAWPYESSGWTAENDPSCGAEEDQDKKVECFTNGNPSETTQAAKKHFLPRHDYLSSWPESIKTYMFKNKRAVISGGSFCYQCWSHGGSKLGVNASNKASGAVVKPGAEAIAEMEEKPAGHSILLLGWDDDKIFPQLDATGAPLRDEQGNIIYDKGFFLFKNSWGTEGTWGARNEFGPGYGWISYAYIQSYGRSVSAPEPELDEPMVEICGDMLDNDANGLTDCEDSACSGNMTCSVEADVSVYSSMIAPMPIPDDDAMGAQDLIEVDLSAPIAQLKVTLDIDHTWRGDLRVRLIGPDSTSVELVKADGSSGEGIKESFIIEEFNGNDAAGSWLLDVVDSARRDEGTLNSWSLEITH